MTLYDRLNMLGTRVNRYYPTINSGGCAVFASIIGEWLLENGISVTGIVSSDRVSAKTTNVDTARRKLHGNTLNQWSRNFVDMYHIGLEITVDGVISHYDSNGVLSPDENISRNMADGVSVYRGRLTVGEITHLAKYGDTWNTMFNRRSIPRLRRHIISFMNTW